MNEDALEPDVAEKLASLRSILSQLPSAIVAYSGGVDSTFLLAMSREVLGERVVALTTSSAAVPQHELSAARDFAADIDAKHVVHDTDEVAIEDYAANPQNRCYFCKDNLYQICRTEADRRDISTILDGVNTDDLGDFRPGLDAAREQEIRHPLVEAGMSKADIRAISAAMGLPTWDKPAQPCLASRFPYGTAITHARLGRVEAAEEAVRSLGFREFRVRFQGETARIEIASEELPRARQEEIHSALVTGVLAAGFARVVLDLRGFVSGSLNRSVVPDRASSN